MNEASEQSGVNATTGHSAEVEKQENGRPFKTRPPVHGCRI